MAPPGWHLGYSYQPPPLPDLCGVSWSPSPTMTPREENWRIPLETAHVGRCPAGMCYEGPSGKEGVISLPLKNSSTDGRQLSTRPGASPSTLCVWGLLVH